MDSSRFSWRRAGGVLATAALVAAGLPMAGQAGAAVMRTTDGPIFISEIHYDNASTDTGEAIEVQAPVGTDLTGWSLVLYNGGNNASYGTRVLTGVVPDSGVLVVSYPSNGIQNGNPDGVALVDPSGAVVEFLSYGGAMTAANGPAAGIASTDIGVTQPSNTPVGLSLQKVNGGWTGPLENTFGVRNSGGSEEPQPEQPQEVLISQVQGSGASSPLDGERVVVDGIVTSLFESNDAPDGFFLQEETPDADEATSEGVFVFCRGECVPVSVGDRVEVTGTVDEFFGMTQIAANGDNDTIEVVSSGNALPVAVALDLPADGSTRAETTFESTEGMVVTFPDRLVVSEYFELARYGQLTLTVDERPYQFTHSNEPSVEGYEAHLADLNTRRIILDDNNNTQNDATSGPHANEPYPWPEGGLAVDNRVRGGDYIVGLTGVLHWSFGGQSGTDAWRIRPIDGIDYTFTEANPAPSSPEDVGGRLTVTSYNVLNYFATVDTTAGGTGPCGPSGTLDCRGADSEQERLRQLTKTVAGLAEIDADVAGLIEIENDEGRATQQIVDALNATTAPGTYAAIDTGHIGTDAIKVALIYQPASVTPVGDYAILDSSVDPDFVDTANRPVLVQTFEEIATGERFTIAVNHLKSKGSACAGDPDLGDGQGNCNETRTAAAVALAEYLATDPTDSGDPDFLIVGDLNAYANEDPITTLEAMGYTDLHEEFEGPDAYSYVFDGQLGYLDTALASASLLPQVTGTTAWHINADEVPLFDYNDDERDLGESAFERESGALPLYAPDPYRSSDHDPVIVGLNLDSDPTEAIVDLRDTLEQMSLHHGTKNALDAKLAAALAASTAGDTDKACDSLQSFINQVNAQTGKKVTPADAAVLLEEALRAHRLLDC